MKKFYLNPPLYLEVIRYHIQSTIRALLKSEANSVDTYELCYYYKSFNFIE